MLITIDESTVTSVIYFLVQGRNARFFDKSTHSINYSFKQSQVDNGDKNFPLINKQ